MRRIRGDDLVQCGICRVLEDPCPLAHPSKSNIIVSLVLSFATVAPRAPQCAAASLKPRASPHWRNDDADQPSLTVD